MKNKMGSIFQAGGHRVGTKDVNSRTRHHISHQNRLTDGKFQDNMTEFHVLFPHTGMTVIFVICPGQLVKT